MTFRWMHALELATQAELPHFTQAENEESAQESQSINDVQWTFVSFYVIELANFFIVSYSRERENDTAL